MKVLLIDNFDSFVYNIYQYLGELECEVDIKRNNEITVEESENYDCIVISPGPGNPDNKKDFGVCKEVILNAKVPVLGVCLGHQGIISAFGGKIVRAEKPMHGKLSEIKHSKNGIFSEVTEPLSVMRYHSLIGEESSMPKCLEIIAKTEDGTIMAVKHKEKPIFGLQFHPESILTKEGKKILKNFLEMDQMKFSDIVNKVIDKQNLEEQEAEFTLEEIMQGKVNNSQIAAFLTALRIKGESVEEITGFVKIMRKYSKKVNAQVEHLVDTAGTGGDGSRTFNISTCSAFVAAGAGARVAKHGNRAASSKSGSADVLEELGVGIDVDEQTAKQQLEEIGMCFLFARNYHPAMKFVASVRKELGFKTVFNLLGPLTNPAEAKKQVIGVYDKKILRKMAEVVRNLDVDRVLIVSSDMDEISVSSETTVIEVEGQGIKEYKIKPEDFGIEKVKMEELKVNNKEESARVIMRVLNGEKGAARDIILLNAGAAIYASGLANSIKEGIKMAEQSIDSGKALEKLKQLKEF